MKISKKRFHLGHMIKIITRAGDGKGIDMTITYWADITGNALGAHDSLKEMGLTRNSRTQEIADELEIHWMHTFEDDSRPDFYELALGMRRDVEADFNRRK